MAEDIAEILGLWCDPAPIASDGLNVVSGEGNSAGDERDDPNEGADKILLVTCAVHHPRVKVDSEQCCEGDGKHGEVGSLDRDLAKPSVQIARKSTL